MVEPAIGRAPPSESFGTEFYVPLIFGASCPAVGAAGQRPSLSSAGKAARAAPPLPPSGWLLRRLVSFLSMKSFGTEL